MASMTIREIEPERDAPAVVELLREASPTAVINVPSWLHRLRSVPPRSRPLNLVAEMAGRVVGRAGCNLENLFTESTELAYVGVNVLEAHRRHGIGTALFERMVTHAAAIGASKQLTLFYENEAGTRFAQAHGFAEVRAEQESQLDPRRVTEVPAAEVDLRRVADVDPRLVHAVDEAATRDLPATEGIEGIPFDEWVGHVLEHPLFTPEGSFVAMADGAAVAVSLLLVDPDSGRGVSMFTGTLREHRGRGLGLAVKLGSIHWAAEHGVTSLTTTNDERNAPMLAINRRLGYVPIGRRVEWLREPVETASSPAPPAPVR